MNRQLRTLILALLVVSGFMPHALPAEPIKDEISNDLKETLKLAQKGDATAQIQLGIAYESGHGVRKDPGQALIWYRKAADQGDGRGMLQVGYAYEAGDVVEKDVGMAERWFVQALSTDCSSMAGYNLVRLSRAGLIKDKYVGIPVEGGSLTTHVDLEVPLEKALDDLAANPLTGETGKAYWIGYNPQMLCIGARGDAALPGVVQFVKNAVDPAVRHAGLLAIHLIGIECDVTGRFSESFRSRKAREALWELMKEEGLTDQVASLLKRDPWPADVPAIMGALRTVKGDCAVTLNALLRYPLSRRPVDPEAAIYAGNEVRFTIPKSYTDQDYVGIAIDSLKEQLGENKVTVEDGLLH